MKIFRRAVLWLSVVLLCACASQSGGEIPEQTADTVGTLPPAEPVVLTETYENPILSPDSRTVWTSDGGFGDPYVMRYNGRYYLYASSTLEHMDVRCWVSDDLLDWEMLGVCTYGLRTDAFAPEVIYDNGYFYMYTSLAGNGHYVYRSESPLGPFRAISENIGLSIDGSVFIDDDGEWYFFGAGMNGIRGYRMTAPNVVDTESVVKTAANLGGWTEGPMITKYRGLYYMTYTGNHVWSPGYRIAYATSTVSALNVRPAENNPLLVSTDKKTVSGIGHSSTVLGPNLDEYYIVYHSYKTVGRRDMNIDRLIFNGDKTVVLGPTVDKEQAPAMPDVYSRFEKEADLAGWTVEGGALTGGEMHLASGGRILSEYALGDDYTAEYNFLSFDGQAGILFSYTDEKNYGRAIFDAEKGSLRVFIIADGVTSTHEAAVTASFGEAIRTDVLNKIYLCRSGDEYTFFVNNRCVLTCNGRLGSGRIGVEASDGEAVIGFVGGTSAVYGSSLKDVYKPIESEIPAITCLNDKTNVTKISTAEYLHVTEGEDYVYRINTQTSGTYDLTITYRASAETVLLILQNGETLGYITLPKSSGRDSDAILRGLVLAEGCGEISLIAESGAADLCSLCFHVSVPVEPQSIDFTTLPTAFLNAGDWRISSGRLVNTSRYGKFVFGEKGWGDYAVEAVITPTSPEINAGLIVRVQNPSDGGDESRSLQATDYLQGYFIGLAEGSVFLGKQNYDWTALRDAPFDIVSGRAYRLRAEVRGATIKIYVDGELLITYTDRSDPFLHGMVGFRVHDAEIAVDEVTLAPLE